MHTVTYSFSCALFPCSLESVPASLQACPTLESNINSGWVVPKQQLITGIWKESGINNSSFLMVPLNFSTSNITSWLAEFWIKEEVGFHLGKNQAQMWCDQVHLQRKTEKERSFPIPKHVCYNLRGYQTRHREYYLNKSLG